METNHLQHVSDVIYLSTYRVASKLKNSNGNGDKRRKRLEEKVS